MPDADRYRIRHIAERLRLHPNANEKVPPHYVDLDSLADWLDAIASIVDQHFESHHADEPF